MARIAAIIVLALTGILTSTEGVKTPPEQAAMVPLDSSTIVVDQKPTPLSMPQQELVDVAMERFEIQGLELPEITIVFRDDLRVCDGHKGMFHRDSQILEMCALDLNTMLHELAHAWANESLSPGAREAFVSSRGLPSWNDRDDPWKRRGTEHVAETIAWALADDPHHVKWVETLPDGSSHESHRVLTIGVDVETLLDNFKFLTGTDPLFRHRGEWADETAPVESPEVVRTGR